MTTRITRRAALATGVAAPFVYRAHLLAQPSNTLNHASFGADGMAWSDIQALTGSPNLRLVAVADVDQARTARVRKQFPQCRIYQDWRELLDKEKDLQSCNISTPDHMHAPITMRAMQRGLNVYTQKPLTQSIYEARQLTRVARERNIKSQMGIQIHSHQHHKAVVETIQAGAIGKVRAVHSWSNKTWGERAARPKQTDTPPASLNWDHWLGVAAARPYIGLYNVTPKRQEQYYHPGNWRKRLDFGTGTFGDMGCHILDPVYSALALTSPLSVRAESGAPNETNWGLDCQVQYTFPGTKFTAERVTLTWYDGSARPPAAVRNLIGKHPFNGQGSIYVGEDGRVLYSPYIAAPILLPEARFADYKRPMPRGDNHYLQFVEACRGNGRTSAPFDYAGPLTEMVLLGCLATRFQKATLEWDAAKMQIKNNKDANAKVRKSYRKGWEVTGL